MARRGDSVIGIDLGKHAFKGVVLNRRNDSRIVLTNFASQPVPESFATPEELGQQIKLLVKELGGAKGCALAVSDPGSLLRIIEQPDTPVRLLRNALRLNGPAVLNQECKDFVLDVSPANVRARQAEQTEEDSPEDHGPIQTAVSTKTKYFVGGMLRTDVKNLVTALGKARVTADLLQLAPACSFNAFEFAYPDIFNNDA